jgi:hypothetical protein
MPVADVDHLGDEPDDVSNEGLTLDTGTLLVI